MEGGRGREGGRRGKIRSDGWSRKEKERGVEEWEGGREGGEGGREGGREGGEGGRERGREGEREGEGGREGGGESPSREVAILVALFMHLHSVSIKFGFQIESLMVHQLQHLMAMRCTGTRTYMYINYVYKAL